ncbi:unnamed protein product [Nezara viridula]|uniref:Uncharacterized protein n=1 Tax=Nezara viridula TaxID=85310 RepID=A0A9P0MWA0_NEZVI|nr:unnamed protein product [Nezara viridula]
MHNLGSLPQFRCLAVTGIFRTVPKIPPLLGLIKISELRNPRRPLAEKAGFGPTASRNSEHKKKKKKKKERNIDT